MQQCPKCGFVQPQDRYCASCGLDIESYKPQPEPLSSRLAKSTALQITLVVAIVLSLGVFIYLSQKEQLDAQLARVLHSTPPPEISTQSLDDSAPPSPTTPDASNETAVASSADGPAAPATDSAATEKANREIIITFAEVSKSVLQQLESEGQFLNESAQVRSFVVPLEDPIRLKERDPEFNQLPGGETLPLRIGSPHNFNFTHLNASNEDIGLDLQINPLQFSENSLELDFDGRLLLKGEAGLTLANQDLNANYTFATKGTLVIIGLLPREQVRPEVLTQFEGSPLSILQSTSFLNGLTEFAIFVQVR